MKKRRNFDTVIFAAAMIAVSGACLAYNIKSAEGSSLTLPLSAFTDGVPSMDSELICEAAAANLENVAALEVSAEPQRDGEITLLPPVVVPDA